MKNKKKLALVLIFLILLAIPTLFWGNLYIVGGDDSRIYYVFPWEFITNFTLKITPDNTLGAIVGYYPKSFWAPIIFVVFVLSVIPFINVQMLMFGLNLACAWLFFYLFLGLWVKNDSTKNFVAKVLSGLFYVFSTYLIKTLFDNQLVSVYLISLMPIVLHFFIRGVRENKFFWIAISVISYSVFSATFTTFTWSVGLIISLLPLFIYLLFKYRKGFVVFSLSFFLLFLLLNSYWLTHHFYLLLFPDGSSFSSFYSSSDFKSSNHFLISQVSSLFNPLNRIFNERDTQILANYNLLIFSKIVFLAVIIFAGIQQAKAKRELRELYFVSLSCLLLSFFLFQPNFGNWSLKLFLFLNDNIPLFSMFRNMSDKFSLAMAFTYAFTFCISFVILSKYIRKVIFYSIVASILAVILFNANKLIFPKYIENNFSIRISGELNTDFKNLVTYLDNNANSSEKTLWLPLNYPSYLYIEDENYKNHFYFGPSILSILTDKSDYAGYLSFGNAFYPEMGKIMFDYLERKDYHSFGYTLKKFNVSYIIENKQNLPPHVQSFLYSPRMQELQNQEFKNAILGNKIHSFGERYSLYEIKDLYKGNKIYLSNPSTKVSFHKLSDVNFDINIQKLSGSVDLTFQEIFNSGWKLYLTGKNQKILLKTATPTSDKLGMTWSLDVDELKKMESKYHQLNKDGSIDLNLKLYYAPQDAIYFGQITTLATTIILLLYLGKAAISDRKRIYAE